MKSQVEPNLESLCPYAASVRAFCLGDLDDEKAIEVEAHLNRCASCVAMVDALAEPSDEVWELLSSLPPTPEDEPEFQRLYARLWESTPDLGDTSADFVPLQLANPPIGPLPQVVDNYELLECVGRGAWGAVYRARHTKLEQTVAVKVLDTTRLHEGAAIELFLQEMKAAGELNHPNIVRATDAGDDRGIHYLVMEFIDGIDAGKLLQRAGPLAIADACEIVRQAAAGLDFAHARSWIHRDVKPSNLLVGRDGVVKLLDLGIAGKHREVDSSDRPDRGDPPSRMPLGTAEYMAPEQWQNFAAVDARADVFSLGCTLYRLLTGSVPFEGGQHRVASSEGIVVSAAKLAERTAIPRGLAKILERMLALCPEDRMASAAEVERELAKWARQAELPELVAEVCGGPRRPSTRRGIGLGKLSRRRILAAGATAAAVTLLLRWAFSEPTPRLRRHVWRDLVPVAPKLVAIEPDARFTCDSQIPARITVSSDELSIVHLGRSVSGIFSVKVGLRQEGKSPKAGLFFQGHFPEDEPQVFEFQSLELRPELAVGGTSRGRIKWCRWRLLEVDNRLSARCDPWGSADVEVQPSANGDELLVTLGRRGLPEVVWNDRPVADSSWEFTAEGRRQVNRTPIQVQRQIIGRLGLVSRGGTTEFFAPRLMYL
jgi:eukaryotic-like serine/threonine-protein kinase